MACLGILASYVLMVAILEDRGVMEEREIWPSAVMLPIIMLQIILALPAWREPDNLPSAGKKGGSKEDPGYDSSYEIGPSSPLLGEDPMKKSAVVDESKESGSNAVVSSGSSLKEIFTDINFWILCIIQCCGTGAGLAVINNIAQQVPPPLPPRVHTHARCTHITITTTTTTLTHPRSPPPPACAQTCTSQHICRAAHLVFSHEFSIAHSSP
jgi:hypothetical protein